MAVRIGGNVHPDAFHLQKGEEFLNAGFGLNVVVVEILHLGLRQVDDLVHGLGQMVFLLAEGGTLPHSQHHESCPQVRGRLDAHGPQQVGPQVVPDVHGVQQCAVHVEDRTL